MSQYQEDPDPIATRLDLQLWGRLLAHARPYRLQGAGMVVCGLLIAAADTAIPLLTAKLIDEATAGTPLAELVPYGVGYGASLFVIAASVWLFIVCAGRISTGVAHDLRRESFQRLQELSLSYYDVRPIGWLVARVTSDIGKVSGLLPWVLLDMTWGTALVTGIVIAMFWLSPWLALVVLTIVPPLAVSAAVFQRWMLESSRDVRRSNAMITASFNEEIAGVRATKILAREQENLAEFQTLSTEMYAHSVRNALQSAVYVPLVLSIGSVGVGLALWRGGVEIGLGVSLGTLVAFMQYAKLFSMPIQEMATQFAQLQAAQAAAERVQGLLDTVPTIVDAGTGLRGEDGPIDLLEFDDVHFAYKAGEPVLSGCSFTVRGGQTVALVGPTGGGKSTIVSLMARFYDITGGSIRLDGHEVRELDLTWLQSRFAFVLQDPQLFKGTVADNIRYGRLEATDAEVRAAADLVAADFIEGLPDGLATAVGEGGGKLSTGQRQLVSMARAVLADPPVLVMDEATSSVDTEAEHAIQRGVEALLDSRISFVIAHRLSTIRSADLVLVVSGGRIVEQGNHDSLMAERGFYYGLVQAQRGATPDRSPVALSPVSVH